MRMSISGSTFRRFAHVLWRTVARSPTDVAHVARDLPTNVWRPRLLPRTPIPIANAHHPAANPQPKRAMANMYVNSHTSVYQHMADRIGTMLVHDPNIII